MFYFHGGNIPSNLLQINGSEDDISILIGENGSGKSTLLNHLAQSFLEDSRTQVIAVANTIHDKFRGRNVRFQTLKSSLGRGVVNKALARCLSALAEDDYKRTNIISGVFHYVGFDATVGFTLRGLKTGYQSRLEEMQLPALAKEQIYNALDAYARRNTFEYYSSDVARIELQNFSHITNRESSMLSLFRYDKELRKAKVFSRIELFLYKENAQIPVHMASSGELTLIATLLYISSIIQVGTVLLIDEPENSLHPKWQMEYVKRLNELFYLYQPKIIIATHSPLIINGGELQSNHIRIYKGESGSFEEQHKNTTNVEQIYEDYFDVTTPQNRYISELVVKQMNALANEEISFEQYVNLINELEENAYDPEQKSVLKSMINMGQKIINAR